MRPCSCCAVSRPAPLHGRGGSAARGAAEPRSEEGREVGFHGVQRLVCGRSASKGRRHFELRAHRCQNCAETASGSRCAPAGREAALCEGCSVPCSRRGFQGSELSASGPGVHAVLSPCTWQRRARVAVCVCVKIHLQVRRRAPELQSFWKNDGLLVLVAF